MCASCGCLNSGGMPWDNHGCTDNITIQDLQAAANAVDLSMFQVVANLAASLPVEKSEPTPSDFAAFRVVKAAGERHFTLGVAYPALRPDVSRAADGHIDAVRPEVLEETAWAWMTKYRAVGLAHKEGTEGHFTPTESYIWRGPDWEVPSPVDGKTYVVKTGSWMLGGLWDDHGWGLVKAQLSNGWSPQGGARRQAASPEFLAMLR